MDPWHLVPGFFGRPASWGYSAKMGHDIGDRAVDDIDAALGVAGEVSEEFFVETVREAFQVT